MAYEPQVSVQQLINHNRRHNSLALGAAIFPAIRTTTTIRTKELSTGNRGYSATVRSSGSTANGSSVCSAKPQVMTDIQDQIVIQQEKVKTEELSCSVKASINPSPINTSEVNSQEEGINAEILSSQMINGLEVSDHKVGMSFQVETNMEKNKLVNH
jgi:hypothetical protein